MKDVAALAGVSVKTVSRVVNHEPHTRPDVVARVRAAIDELGWRPNRSARALRTGRTGTVGIAVAELRRPYLATLVEELVNEAQRQGLAAVVEPTHRDPGRTAAVLGARGRLFDGVVHVGAHDGTVDGALGDRPVVVVQGGRIRSQVDHVDEDVVSAAALIARHLAVMGSARPVLLGPDRAHSGEETDAVSAVLTAALLAVGIDAARVPQIAIAADGDRRAGFDAAQRALTERPDLDALVCVSDEVALGAMAALASAGVAIPDDVSVVGYDNLADGEFSTPSLTTIDPGPGRLARAALELFTDRLRGHAPADGREVVLPVELVRRESTMGLRH